MFIRKVYLGSFNNIKKEELINKSIEKLKKNQGNEFFYILPNGELLRQYRQNFIDLVDQAFEINLFTFDDIVNRILEDDLTQIIDNPTKNLILRVVLKRLSEENKLSYYKDFVDMPGFINSINDIIGDIKRSLIYPNEYLDRCPNKPIYLEMGLIYSHYEKILAELNISDREGTYFKSVDLLKTNDFLSDIKTIIIDEFYDFRPIELAVLEQLINSNIDIIINIPFESHSKSIILENTLYLLKGLGFEIENIKDSPRSQFERIGGYLFTNEEELFEANDDINIINAATPLLELRKVFEEIKRYHKVGVDLNNMAIIITNPSYQEILHKISVLEGIPISKNKATPLITMSITRELLNIIEGRMANYSKTTLINRIKSNYFAICPGDKRDLFEMVLRKTNFRDIIDLKAFFKSNKNLDISIKEMDWLDDIVQSIEKEYKEISLKGTIESFNRIIKSILKHHKLENNLLNRYRETNDELLFLRDMRTINRIEEIIDNMEHLAIFDDEIDLKDYYFLLIDFFKEGTVIEIQGNIKGVHILNPTNSRGSIKDIIFITGLSQVSYPVIDDGNYFMNDYNLKDLKAIGIEVRNYRERLDNESLKFASIIASCRKKIHLSYSCGQDDIEIKSIFLDELLVLFKKDDNNKPIINEVRIGLDYIVKKSMDDVTNYGDLTRYIIKSYFKEEIDTGIICEYSNLCPGKLNKINRKISSEVNRYQGIYDEYRGVLGEKNILKDIESTKPSKFSISYLESYSKCPYFFMLNNMLKVEELGREYEEYSPIDLGKLYHDVLSHYYKRYRDDIKNKLKGIGEFSFEATIDYLKDRIYRSAQEIGLKRDSNKDILIIDIAIKRLTYFLEKDIEKTIRDKRIPYVFEMEFGSKKPFYIEKDGVKIAMIGRIDRIDEYLEKEDFVAIDYKSSASGLRNIGDMTSGLSLQLPIYILSQEDKHMVAGAYSIINSGETKICIGIDPFVTLRGKGKLSQEEWDALMETTKDNIYQIIVGIGNGYFQVKPLECSPYCIYKDICRYEDVVEVEE